MLVTQIYELMPDVRRPIEDEFSSTAEGIMKKSQAE